MYRYKYLLLLSLFMFCGCSDASRPGDLPQLFPCVISVMQGGKPLAEALVEFHAESEQKYRPSAFADVEGNAVMRTYGFPGVPAGKYKITISKTIEDDFVYRTGDTDEQIIVSSNTYKTVEDLYSSVETTPHEIEITSTSKGKPVTLDVGEAMRTKIRKY